MSSSRDERLPPSEASDASWRSSGVIALLTDFGLQDPYVGQMKGVMLTHFAGAHLVDLTHGVPPQNVRVGAFQLSRSARWFPPGTVFVAVVDPEVGTSRRILVAEDDSRAFLAPDNGLLPAALSSAARYRELDLERFALPGRSRTFHGRDVFAPAAAAIAAGLAPAASARADVHDARTLAAAGARRVSERRIEAHVLFADRYGNVVLDALPEDLEGGLEQWRVEHGTRSIAFAGTYADVRPGEWLALVDSFGSIEIARRDGSARDTLDLADGATVVLTRAV